VIVVSGCGKEITRRPSLEAGCDYRLVKPFDPREIISRSRKVLITDGPSKDANVCDEQAICWVPRALLSSPFMGKANTHQGLRPSLGSRRQAEPRHDAIFETDGDEP
jgi:DNA-binding response OmpR family regulator